MIWGYTELWDGLSQMKWHIVSILETEAQNRQYHAMHSSAKFRQNVTYILKIMKKRTFFGMVCVYLKVQITKNHRHETIR